MEECNELFQLLLKEEKLKNVPVLVYANKADLDNCLSTDTVKKKLKMDDITGRESAIYAISALNGTGVKEGIKWLFEKNSEK